MEETLVKEAVGQGLWAVLFISLYVHQLRDSKNRETRLMDCLDNITGQFQRLAQEYERLRLDVNEIKEEIRK